MHSIFVSHSRFWRVSALVASGALLSFLIVGCGGGGSGASTPTATPSATTSGTPVATSISASCDSTTYTPNYYGLRDPSATNDSPGVYNFWRQFPISVYIPSGGNAAFRTETIAGFNQWLTATNSRTKYTLVSSAADADLVVGYSGQDDNSDTLGLTTVTYNTSQHYILSAKMELFFYTTSQRADAAEANQSIAAHEFGHALGIGPHSPYTADLMYPYLSRVEEEVTTRDLNTLKTIYCNKFPTTSTRSLKNEGPTKTIVIRN